MIGAGSVVTNNIPSNALVYGNPAKVRGFVCICGRKLEIQEKKENNVLMKMDVKTNAWIFLWTEKMEIVKTNKKNRSMC